MNRVWNTHTQINTKMQKKHEHSHTFVPIAPGGKAGLVPASSSVPGAGGSVSLSSSISISTSIISSSLSGRGGGGGGESGGSGGGGGAQGGGGGLSGRGGWDGDQREDAPGWGGVVGAKEWVSFSIKSIYIYNTVVLATVKTIDRNWPVATAPDMGVFVSDWSGICVSVPWLLFVSSQLSSLVGNSHWEAPVRSFT